MQASDRRQDLRGSGTGTAHPQAGENSGGRGQHNGCGEHHPGAPSGDVRLDGEARESRADPRADAAVSRQTGLHSHPDHVQEDQHQVLRRGRHTRSQTEVLPADDGTRSARGLVPCDLQALSGCA